MEAERHTLDIKDGSIAWAERGSGPPIVLIHGTLTSLDDSLIALGDAVAAEGWRAVAFDRPGNGASSGGSRTISIWDQARLLAQAAEALNLERPVLVGHSQGATVALAWATQFPDSVAGVVALGPVVAPEPRLEHYVFGPRSAIGFGDMLSYAAMPMDGLLMPLLWRGLFAPQPVPPAFAGRYPVDLPGERARLRRAGEEAMQLIPDLARLMAALPGCSVPMRVLRGEMDLVVNPLHGQAVAALAPDASFRSLPGLGHMIHHFAQPDVVDAVRSVLAFPRSPSRRPLQTETGSSRA